MVNIINEYLAKRINLLREEKGISMYKLAQALNLNRSTISHLESGKARPSLEVLYNLAKFFDVSVDFLLGLSDFRAPMVPLEKIWPEGADLIRRAALELPPKEKKLLIGIIATFLEQNEQEKVGDKNLFPRHFEP